MFERICVYRGLHDERLLLESNISAGVGLSASRVAFQFVVAAAAAIVAKNRDMQLDLALGSSQQTKRQRQQQPQLTSPPTLRLIVKQKRTARKVIAKRSASSFENN